MQPTSQKPTIERHESSEAERFVSIPEGELQAYPGLSEDAIRMALARGERERQATVAAGPPGPVATRTRYG